MIIQNAPTSQHSFLAPDTNAQPTPPPDKYVGTIKPKTQNAVLPAKRATQHFGFWVYYDHLLTGFSSPPHR